MTSFMHMFSGFGPNLSSVNIISFSQGLVNDYRLYPLMARLGIAEGKVPYSARHTYSDKFKRAHGDDKMSKKMPETP